MKKAALYICLLLVQFGFSQDTAIINRMRKATLQILVYEPTGRIFGSGTGFFINQEGKLNVMTCFHVVAYDVKDSDKKSEHTEIRPRIRGITWAGDTIDLHLIDQNNHTMLMAYSKYDFAVLAPAATIEKLKSTRTLPLSTVPPYVGEHIYFSGYPIGKMLISEYGMITGDEKQYLYFNPSCLAGDSGGPLLDEIGGVIAIVDFKITGKGDTSGEPDYIKKLFDRVEAIGNVGIGGATKMSSINNAFGIKY